MKKSILGSTLIEYILATAMLFGGFLIGAAIYNQAQKQRYEESVKTVSESLVPCSTAIKNSAGVSNEVCW